MIRLNPEIVLRAEADGALLFNPQNARVVYLSTRGLRRLRDTLSGNGRSRSIALLDELGRGSFIARCRSRDRAGAARLDRLVSETEKVVRVPHALAAPETLHLAVTTRCDQECRGCFYSGSPGMDMDRELIDGITGDAVRHGILQVALGGGEPLLHPDILGIVGRFRDAGVVPNITTNGNLLDREMAASLRDAGVGQVQISLNGPDREINSRTRPNFQKAMEAIRACRREDLRYGINFLLMRSNLHALHGTARLSSANGAATLNLLRPKPPVHDPDWLREESPSRRQYGKLARDLPALERACSPARLTLDASFTFLMAGCPPERLFAHGVWGCSAGRRFLTVSESGTLFACSHYREPVGQARHLMEAWRTSALLNRFRDLPALLRKKGEPCSHLDVCRGCPALADFFRGALDAGDPHCFRDCGIEQAT